MIAIGSVVGLVVSARSLQLGKAVPVIAITSVAANALTIAAGPLVFEEPFPRARRGSAARRRVRARDRRRRADPGAGCGGAPGGGVSDGEASERSAAAQPSPTYQSPKLTPNSPIAGISTVR